MEREKGPMCVIFHPGAYDMMFSSFWYVISARGCSAFQFAQQNRYFTPVGFILGPDGMFFSQKCCNTLNRIQRILDAASGHNSTFLKLTD